MNILDKTKLFILTVAWSLNHNIFEQILTGVKSKTTIIFVTLLFPHLNQYSIIYTLKLHHAKEGSSHLESYVIKNHIFVYNALYCLSTLQCLLMSVGIKNYFGSFVIMHIEFPHLTSLDIL